jgi:peptide/nickel transport system permease protein
MANGSLTSAQPTAAILTRRAGGSARRTWWRHRNAMVGVALLASIGLGTLLAPFLGLADPATGTLSLRLKPPAWQAGGSIEHLLGTDPLGRDVLSRVLYGGRISLFVGLSTTVISTLVGIAAGLFAGYYGGWRDDLMMRIAEIQLSFPFLALAVAVVAVLGTDLKNVILVLGLAGWVLFARVVRAEALTVRRMEYVEAARAVGQRDVWIILRHVLPNVAASVIVLATFTFAYMIIVESSLSFLGLGVPPPTPTWGGMLSDSREYIQLAWWPVTFPGLALMMTSLGINLLGDWLRDVLDPRLKHTGADV